MRTLIAVIGCDRLYSRIQAIRDTWANDVPKDGTVDLRFFFGRGQYTRPPDEIMLDVEESYAALPAKVQALFRWSVENGYDRTFKVDDDVYVSTVMLLRCNVAPHDYVGRFRGPSGGYPADYASGYGYWLSQKAARIVADGPLNKDWAEDRWVGNLLAWKGIQGWKDDASYIDVYPKLMPEVICTSPVGQAAAFCEFADPQALRRMHTCYKSTVNPKFFLPNLPRPVLQAALGEQDFFRDPTDAPDWNKQQSSLRAAGTEGSLIVCPRCHGKGTVTRGLVG